MYSKYTTPHIFNSSIIKYPLTELKHSCIKIEFPSNYELGSFPLEFISLTLFSIYTRNRRRESENKYVILGGYSILYLEYRNISSANSMQE